MVILGPGASSLLDEEMGTARGRVGDEMETDGTFSPIGEEMDA